jgi:hypothetical protein
MAQVSAIVSVTSPQIPSVGYASGQTVVDVEVSTVGTALEGVAADTPLVVNVTEDSLPTGFAIVRARLKADNVVRLGLRAFSAPAAVALKLTALVP